MFILYDLIFLLFTLVSLPVYYLKRKFHPGFAMRLGILPKGLPKARPIWVHAVSIGEAMVVRKMVEKLKASYPARPIVISTVTPTGNKIAKIIAKENDFTVYLPLDFSFIVRRVINKINPEIFIIAETEIWPNLIHCLYKKNIPVIVVNGRISDTSFGGYLFLKPILKPILNKVNIFCVQSELDKERLLRMGLEEKRVQVTGNMKLDNIDLKVAYEASKYRAILGLGENEKLLIAGSTHPGEEEAVLGAYKELLKDFSQLRLLIAPRHPQRSRAIEKIAARFGFKSSFVSSLPAKCPECIAGAVFILDTLGQLVSFYAAADIVFVGKSLVNKGGQNILEPAGLAKPVIFGPSMFNFRHTANLFLENNAAVQVRCERELVTAIGDLLKNPDRMREMGQTAQRIILEHQGATEKNLQIIKNLIDDKKLSL